MLITVAMCTWNRARLLNQTLMSMRRLHVANDIRWELLVVNNRCTDDSDEVIARHADCLPIRRLFEPNSGLSHARNCALAAAQGDLMIWTDDDVLVDPEWLAAYDAAARRWPKATYFGGTVDPLFAEEPPSWVRENVDLLTGPFAVRQLGDGTRPFLGTESPFGANMAFRRSALEGLSFCTNLGRQAGNLISGEETELVDRLKRRGDLGIWVGPARVRHYLPAERMCKKYVWDWFEGAGVTGVRMGETSQGVSWFNMPRWALRSYVQCRLAAWRYAFTDDRKWLQAYQKAAKSAGILAESRRQCQPQGREWCDTSDIGSERFIPNAQVSATTATSAPSI